MFSLIIVIISIALVAALALATIYYGGTSFNIGGDRVVAARTINEGNQVAGALELYRVDNGAFPTGTSQDVANALIAGNYLSGMPENSSWEFRTDFAVRTNLTLEQCERVNADLNIPNPPPLCSDPAISGRSVCCVTP